MLPTIVEARSLFARGALRPSELLAQLLERVDRHETSLNSYVALFRDEARKAALRADASWQKGQAEPLSGIPLALKDIFDVAGTRTGCGTTLDRAPATEDAEAVQLLRKAGALLLGKNQLHQFAFGLTGENPALGTPKNPHAEGHLPGGSSSGSAVAVAAGLALASLGTDTGGSVRLPAAFCGICGFKPSHGAISAAGVFPVAPSMDHVGVLARSVADCSLLFSILAPEARPSETPQRSPRIGLIGSLQDSAQPEVAEAVESMLAQASGVSVEPIELSELKAARRSYVTLVLAEIGQVHRELFAEHRAVYQSDSQWMVERGLSIGEEERAAAHAQRLQLAGLLQKQFEHFDALACATVPIPAPPLGAETVRLRDRDVAVGGLLVGHTSPFSLLGLPAISVPAGEVDGRPVGLQLVAAPGRDHMLLDLAETVFAEAAPLAPLGSAMCSGLEGGA